MADGRNPGDHIGDYELSELLSAGTLTSSWKARQLSVEREVILEIVKKKPSADERVTTGFLADVRVKARLHHPAIGHVYEAHSKGGDCFYVREVLGGDTIEEWLHQGRELPPATLVDILATIADSQILCGKKGIAFVPWQTHHFHLTEAAEPQVVNLAVDGDMPPGTDKLNKQILSEILRDLLDPSGHPATTRTLSLLDYMADDQSAETISWEQIRDYTRTIRQQLAAAERARIQESAPLARVLGTAKKIPAWLWTLVLGILALGITVIALKPAPGKKTPATGIVRQPESHIPIVVDGKKAYALGISEVSIADYAAFLEHLGQLSAKSKTRYDHPEQATEKTAHLPDDWSALISAARSDATWNGLTVSPDCPVIGIDWWDATAYAEWKNERLPTKREWQLATREKNAPAAISAWGPARASREDRTPDGLIGLAGNVGEWVADRSIDPAFPLNPVEPMACGGSYLKPAKGHLACQWLDSRSDRRPDLGFRTAKDL